MKMGLFWKKHLALFLSTSSRSRLCPTFGSIQRSPTPISFIRGQNSFQNHSNIALAHSSVFCLYLKLYPTRAMEMISLLPKKFLIRYNQRIEPPQWFIQDSPNAIPPFSPLNTYFFLVSLEFFSPILNLLGLFYTLPFFDALLSIIPPFTHYPPLTFDFERLCKTSFSIPGPNYYPQTPNHPHNLAITSASSRTIQALNIPQLSPV